MSKSKREYINRSGLIWSLSSLLFFLICYFSFFRLKVMTMCSIFTDWFRKPLEQNLSV